MEYIAIIATVALVHLLAVMSPGPDFVMVLRNSLVYSRRSGLYTAIGLGLGIMVHVTYSLLGVALIIANSIVLFTVLKFVAAGYLIYIGLKSLLSKSKKDNTKLAHEEADLTKFQALRSGFITNVTNPKATLFFLSLFTVMIDPMTPLEVKLFMGGEMVVATSLWFALVAFLVSHKAVRARITRVQHHVERVMGAILVAFGITIATASSK